ncbi:MAG: saccharopine dehydrogenase NADP-binding domain-containing protein [Solirubrobacterales bacterium]
MATVAVLGGAGGIGSTAVRALACFEEVGSVTVADRDLAGASRLVDEVGDDRLEAVGFDAASPQTLSAALRGADAVVNCVGPFYRFGPPILEAAIEAGVAYVDVCDDLDATVRMLEMDGRARERGVRALIGMGNSPGLANVLVRFCADHLLDRVDGAEIMHVHGGEPDEGPAVIKHRIHAMTNDVPLFVDGEFVSVRMLEESARPFLREVDFPDVGTCTVYPYPHPETITLPRHIEGISRATNLGVVVPFPYFELTMDAVRLGICGEREVEVAGTGVPAIDFAVAFIRSRRPGLLAEAGIAGPRGCLKVEVSGTRGGERHLYEFTMSSGQRGAGEGTGIPAALGAILMLRGAIGAEGVFPPEAAVVPTEMIALAREVVPHFGIGGGLPLTLEHRDGSGAVERVELPL